jgi:hypothetical protein
LLGFGIENRWRDSANHLRRTKHRAQLTGICRVTGENTFEIIAAIQLGEGLIQDLI